MFLTSDRKSLIPLRESTPIAQPNRTEYGALRRAQTTWFYALMRHFWRFVKRQCLREVLLHPERAQREGGYLLAPTHVSHIEPVLMTCLLDRPITWMARVEFFRVPVLASMLRWADSFSVNRQGVPVHAIRTAIARARNGEVVGIFPEGGCRKGSHLAFRAGHIKQGICTVAIRSGVPIVPVVVLGTHALNDIDPWIPGHQGKVWVAFGDEIMPPPFPKSRVDRRRVRQQLARQLEQEYVRTYHALLTHALLSDDMTP